MRKSSKRVTIIVFPIVSLILLGVLIFLLVKFGPLQQTAIAASSPVFTQYETSSCGASSCSYIAGKLVTATTAIFPIAGDIWTVTNEGGVWGSCGADSRGYVIGGCCTTTKVYKNGVLVDTINQGYSGNKASMNTAYTRREYCQDGTFDNCRSKNQYGLGVQPLLWSAAVSPGECANRQNGYNLIIPAKAMDINISTPKTQYTQGEDVQVQVKVRNSMANTTGKLSIAYEVPTIIGSASKTEQQDVNLPLGDTTFSFTIPSSAVTPTLKVTPSLTINYPTAGISGVNYPFEGGSLQPVSSRPYFEIGTIVENTTTLSIISSDLQKAAEQINSLSGSIEDKAKVIASLNLTLSQQVNLINALNLKVEDNARLIQALTSNLSEQAALINQLTTNLDTKAQLVAQLTAENQKQADLISEMKMSFSDEGTILDKLNLTIADDARVISNLTSNNKDQASIISKLNLNTDQQETLIQSLESNITAQQNLIKSLQTAKSDSETMLIIAIGISVILLVGLAVVVLLILRKRATA